MSILRWLKIQWYLPQFNKASHLVAYYKMIVEDYSKRYDVTSIKGRRKGTFDHAERALGVWEYKKEQLERKLERIKREYGR